MRGRSLVKPELNASILRWSRKHAEISVEKAATRAKVPPERIRNWENSNSDDRPTIRQARKLANLYGRSVLEFFGDEIPPVFEPIAIPDFRLSPHSATDIDKKSIKSIRVWVEAQRANALSLYSDIGDNPPTIPSGLYTNIHADVELAAQKARKFLEFPIHQQVDLKRDERRGIPKRIRNHIGNVGVLVLRCPELASENIRGFCVYLNPMPIIVLSQESPTAEAFTLMHEFAHVLLQSSAISGHLTPGGGAGEIQAVENWCNRFAAAFLMPRKEVDDLYPETGVIMESVQDERLRKMAEYFGVSEEAMLIRLVQLKRVKSSYYWDIKKPQFDELAKSTQSYGRSSYYGSRFRNRQGDLYTSLVLEALSLDRITSHNAAEYMGFQKIDHLYEIQANFP